MPTLSPPGDPACSSPRPCWPSVPSTSFPTPRPGRAPSSPKQLFPVPLRQLPVTGQPGRRSPRRTVSAAHGLFSGNLGGSVRFWKKPDQGLGNWNLPPVQLVPDGAGAALFSSDLVTPGVEALGWRGQLQSRLRPNPAGVAGPRGWAEKWVDGPKMVKCCIILIAYYKPASKLCNPWILTVSLFVTEAGFHYAVQADTEFTL